MTEEKYQRARKIMYDIATLENLCKYKGIRADGIHNLVDMGLFTEEEFDTIIDNANEQIRKRAEEALKLKQEEFAKL